MPMHSPWAQWGYKAQKSRPVGEGGLSGTVEGGISWLSLSVPSLPPAGLLQARGSTGPHLKTTCYMSVKH